MYYHKPVKVGVGIGVFGAAFTLLTTALLILVPQELMTPAARSAYVQTWSGPIMTVGAGVLVYGIPLLGAASAYYLTRQNYPVKSVMAGFVIGGLVFGLGDAVHGATTIHLFADDPAALQTLSIRRIATLSGRLIGGAVIGILCAVVIDKRFRDVR